MVYNFFDKKSKGSGVTLPNKSAIKSIPQNEQLTEELQKLIIRKFFTDNIADLLDIQLKSKFSKGFKLLLCY